MPVSYPPPPLPQPAPIAELRRAAPAARYAFGGYTLNLVAFDGYDARELQLLVASSADAEKLVLGLGNLVYQRGDLSARLLYAVSGDQLYVMLARRPVRRVTGDIDITRFFSAADTPGARFDFASFERERVLASGYADRAGMEVLPRFRDAPGGYVDLELLSVRDPEAQRLAWSLEAGNQGSRFAGRNVLGLGLTGNTLRGLEAGLEYKTSSTGVDDTQTMGDYAEGGVQLSQITPLGVFGLSAKRIEFTLDGPPGIDGWYHEYGVEWSNLLHAAPDSRLLGRLRLAYADRQSESASDQTDLFHERYAALDFTPAYSGRSGAHRLDGSIALVAGQAQSVHNSAAEERFQLLRPMLRYGWEWGEDCSVTVLTAGQWSAQVLPEYQQWTLGGMSAMSAYLPATFYGDAGYYLRLANEAVWKLRPWNLSLEIFGEHGSVRGESSDATGSVSDAGLALTLGYKRHLELKLQAAQPIGGPTVDDSMLAEFYLQLKATY
jgi:hypothetical protein